MIGDQATTYVPVTPPDFTGAPNHPAADAVDSRLARAMSEWERERRSVGEIQRMLLPAQLPAIPGFELAAYYRPSEHAGGDYYDVVPLVHGRWGLVMADVVGHGVAAAIIVAVMRTLIHANLADNRDKPSGVFLETVNRVMSGMCLRDGRFVTVWCAVLDPGTRHLTYASAGHNPPRLCRGRSVVALDAVGGLPIGLDPETTYEESTVTLGCDDLLVIYTDGITEAMRPSDRGPRQMFGARRLDESIAQSGDESPAACIARLTRAVAEFTGFAPASDDQAMLVVRVTPAPARSAATAAVPGPVESSGSGEGRHA